MSDLHDRDCPKCDHPVLYGSIENVLPEQYFSRTPIIRESARILTAYGVLVIGARRIFGGDVVTTFWRDELGPAWTALKQHDCEVWR